jgi:hypothetical protein
MSYNMYDFKKFDCLKHVFASMCARGCVYVAHGCFLLPQARSLRLCGSWLLPQARSLRAVFYRALWSALWSALQLRWAQPRCFGRVLQRTKIPQPISTQTVKPPKGLSFLHNGRLDAYCTFRHAWHCMPTHLLITEEQCTFCLQLLS